MQQNTRRPLSRYLKEFKLSQTQCAHCRKPLDRVTLVRNGEIINQTAISRFNEPMDELMWLQERWAWSVLCRFCSDLHCNEQNAFFNITGFKLYLLEQTDMSTSTMREYIVRLRRLGNYFVDNQVPSALLLNSHADEVLSRWLPKTNTTNYRIALRKYLHFQHANRQSVVYHESMSID